MASEQLDLFPEDLERFEDLKEVRELVRALLDKLEKIEKDVEELKKRPALDPFRPIGPSPTPRWPGTLPDTHPMPKWPLDGVICKDPGTPMNPFGSPTWTSAVTNGSSGSLVNFSDVRDLLSYPSDEKATLKINLGDSILDETGENP